MGLQIRSAVVIATFIFVAVYASAPIDKEIEAPVESNTNQDEKDKYGLKGNKYKPETYTIAIKVDDTLLGQDKFDGVVDILLAPDTTTTTTQELLLHSADLNVKSCTMKDVPTNNDIGCTAEPSDSKYETQKFKFTSETTAATKYVLHIEYGGNLQKNMRGFYKSQYSIDNNEKFVLTTQLQPTHARRVLPCYDEPQYKAKFTLTLEHPAKYKAISNTKVAATPTGKTQFAQTPKMSTYLLAFVISEFEGVLSHTKDGIVHSIYNRYGYAGLTRSAYSLTESLKLLAEMERVTGELYSTSAIGKVDHVALPDFDAGAMENWGLVTYRESIFLHDGAETSTKNAQRISSVIAHELSHFWFGNLVTTEKWDTTWLNEGLARYFEYMATHAIHKDWELDKQFVVEQHLNIMNADSLPSSASLNAKAYSPAEIRGKFSSITYNKGATIIRMMANFIPEEKFTKGLKDYISTNRNGIVKPDKLWDAFDYQPNGKSLANTMESYVSKAGLPLLIVRQDDTRVKIKQEQFKLQPDPAKADNKYIVPIKFTIIDQGNQPLQWIEDETEKDLVTLTNVGATVIVNPEAYAYARVLYSKELYAKIKATLMKENFGGIDEISRAQIVDDVLNLARAGKHKYEDALEFIDYLKTENSYYPWYSAFKAFQFLLTKLPADETKSLKRYILVLMENIDKAGPSSHINSLKKTMVKTWRCNMGDANTINEMIIEFNKLKNDAIRPHPSSRSVAYCEALKNDDGANWKILSDQLKESNLLPSEANILMTALGCIRNENKLKEYLERIIQGADLVRKQDAYTVFSSVISDNPVGVKVALAFIKEKHTELSDRFKGMDDVSDMLANLIGRLTKDQIDKFKDFLDEKEPAFKETAKKLIVSAEKDLEWVDVVKPQIKKFFDKYFKDEPPKTTTPKSTTKKPGSVAAHVPISILLIVSNLFLLFYIKQ